MKRSGESEWERETEKEKKKRGILLDSSGLSFTHSFFLFPSFLLSSLKERAPSFPFIPFATMPLYQVAIPAIVLAHAIGLALLLYSLEKVSGIVSRTTRRLSWKKKGATSPSASSAPESAEAGRANNHSVRSLQPSPTKSIHNTVKSKGWIRGCACTVSSIIGAFFVFFSCLGRDVERASEAAMPLDSWGRVPGFARRSSRLLALSTRLPCWCGAEHISVVDRSGAAMARVDLLGAAERAGEDWRNTQKKASTRSGLRVSLSASNETVFAIWGAFSLPCPCPF